ncbi:MAG: STAS domain-containing protein [Spirochaetales bacterium]|uniref:STAS domain-containing protein n=1 Tax=Candidatus Thalassospirochaeta sargassi TaxID=3119039 RepID=A0AAJ1MIF5_9SPIO|nr:STAS domain-containing protein [Spirochaetales bacterium]
MKKDLESNLTIEYAAQAAESLKTYIRSEDNPVIDLSVVERIDLAGIQLLLSVEKTGENISKDVFFTGDLVSSVYERIFNCGFNTVFSDASEKLFKIRRNSSEF